jgi:hypothetical protein
MPLFKTGDAIKDQYAAYSTEQLIQIVIEKNGNYTPGVVETARTILLGRGFDYRTKEQKAAQKELHAINTTRENTGSAILSQPLVRPTRPNNQSKNSSIKSWHWFLIIFFILRMVGCLIKFRQH